MEEGLAVGEQPLCTTVATVVHVRRYRLSRVNSLQEPEPVGEYASIEQLLLALLLLLREKGTLLIEVVE